jgi:uncharacterized membrane protein YhaH (DUF805 family)
MNAFFVSIAHNLRRLLDFSGRESQILFWPYAGFIYALATVVSSFLIMAPVMEMLVQMMKQIRDAAEQGGNAEPAFIKAPEMLMPDFSGLVLPIVLVNLATIALLAAAIARRLHDKDRSGYWGLLPLPTMLIGLVFMPQILAGFIPPRQSDPLLGLLMLNNLASFGLIVVLVILLVGKGSEGPNRFGTTSAVPD